MTEQGFIKSKKILKRVKGAALTVFFVSAAFTLVSSISLLGLSMYHNVKNPVNEYMGTKEYQEETISDVNDVMIEFYKGNITIEETSEQLDEIRSREHAENMLMNSEQKELKARNIADKKGINGLSITTVASIGTSLAFVAAAGASAYALYAVSEKEEQYLRRRKREEADKEEEEDEGI